VARWVVGWGAPGYTAGKDAPKLVIELEREDDGCWIAEVPALPGVMVYGQSREAAIAGVEVLALRVLADRLEHGETVPELSGLFHAA
jgi:predicted RNase H-like HicB family nuclease